MSSRRSIMLGAIIGDIVGSRFEFVDDILRPKNFALFTPSCRPSDDSFMTLAVAEALLLSKGDQECLQRQVISSMKKIAHKHPKTGWARTFIPGYLRKTIPSLIKVMETAPECESAPSVGSQKAKKRSKHFPKPLPRFRIIIRKVSKELKRLPWRSISRESVTARMKFEKGCRNIIRN